MTRLCSIEGCGKSLYRSQYCAMHYSRSYKGLPMTAGPMRTPKAVIDAFYETALWAKEEKCVIWPFQRSWDGYAIRSPRKTQRSQRVARQMCFDLYGEPPSPDCEGAHSCGNGRGGCVNGSHLRWASPDENRDDKVKHGTIYRGEGHYKTKLTEEDVIDIRSLHASSGMTLVQIGERHGTTKHTIWDIVHRKTWKHVP